MKSVQVYDIETLINFFCVTFADIKSKKLETFIIDENQNNLQELIKFIQLDCLGLIGFNNINFDYPIFHRIIKNKIGNQQIFDLAQNIIESQNKFDISKYKYIIYEKDWIIPQLDLFKIWHFDNRAKRTSLKDVQMAMNWPNLQSNPFDIHLLVNEEQKKQVIEYNINDILSTLEFYNITKGQTNIKTYSGDDKIQLRYDIKEEFDINCINYNDVKIGDSISKSIYLKLSNKSYQELKDLKTIRPIIHLKDCISDEIQFKTKKLNDLLYWLKAKSITSTKGEISKTLDFANIKFEIKQGGIHTKDTPGLIISDEEYIIMDFDIDSEYPSAIIKFGLFPAHLGKEWLVGYTQQYNKRIEAKKRKKEAKKFDTINKTFKLSLNGGGYGKTGEPNSWQFDPLVTMTVTINCQLFILMLCEELSLQEFEIISANTDGITVKCKKGREDIIRKIVANFTIKTNFTFEENIYQKLIRTSISDYIAVKEDNSIKLKGDFDVDKEIHKNHSMRIRSLMILNYFINNISLEDTIKDHSYGKIYKFGKDEFTGFGIYDYCLYTKFTYGFYGHLYTKIDELNLLSPTKVELMPKNLRYIISNQGGELHKVSKSNTPEERDQRINLGYFVQVANKITFNNQLDYNLNYQFYIDECNKIISQVENPIIQIKRTNRIKQDNTKQLKLF